MGQFFSGAGLRPRPRTSAEGEPAVAADFVRLTYPSASSFAGYLSRRGCRSRSLAKLGWPIQDHGYRGRGRLIAHVGHEKALSVFRNNVRVHGEA